MEEKFTQNSALRKNTRIVQANSEYRVMTENAVILSVLGLIWLVSGLSGMSKYPEIAILVFFTGLCMLNPITSYTRKSLDIKNSNPLKAMVSCIILGVPAGLILGFFPFYDNINYFFPAFMVLFAFIFALNYFAFKLKMHIALAVMLLSGAIYMGLYYPNNFWMSGLFTASTLLGFALVSKIYGRYKS
ncbi:hypothetical protein RCC89_09010 [Cytophagaceae bacterium ABcell3]|nr:hypothetical protein RCC89_09010 [Cytophagaceae bacterium ABcell3]